MSRHAWAYIALVIGAGIALSSYAISVTMQIRPHLLTFVVLTLLATITQLLDAEAPSGQSYYPHLVFFFAGMLLLPPLLFVFLVAIPHIFEWIKK